MAYASSRRLLFEILEFESALDFFDGFAAGVFSVVFMDIYMYGMDGMAAAKEIYRLDRECKIIFLTTTGDYSVQGYSVRAVYYLVKPLSDAELLQAMELCELKPENRVPLLAVVLSGTRLGLDTSKILYIDYINRATRIHISDQILTVSGTFSEVTAPLMNDGRFLLCIRGVVVNMRYITRQEGDLFVLQNGERLPINIRRKKHILQAYRRFVFGSMGEMK